jgi:hypothetical protein
MSYPAALGVRSWYPGPGVGYALGWLFPVRPYGYPSTIAVPSTYDPRARTGIVVPVRWGKSRGFVSAYDQETPPPPVP